MTSPTSKKITLSFTIQHDGREIGEIILRRPKVKDLRSVTDADSDQLSQGVAIAAVLSGLPAEAIEELDAEDFTAISEVIADFFPKGPGSPTGAA